MSGEYESDAKYDGTWEGQPLTNTWRDAQAQALASMTAADRAEYAKYYADADADPINQPAHYRSHPSGIETIEITRHENFCIGSAIKYLMRCDHKTDDPIQDLRKAIRFIEFEIETRQRHSEQQS